MKGIDNLKVNLGWCIDTFLDIKVSKEDDGKINLKDGPRFIDNITRIPALIKSAPESLEELLDLDGQEAEEIALFVIEKTGVAHSKVKLVIEKAVIAAYATSEWVKAGLDLADAIRDLKDI